MRRPELPIVSFLCVPLLLCSLPSHVRAGSVATMALIAWLAVVSIIRGINAIVWAENVVVRLEVWCDITTKITIGFTYAVPASALCVLRHLESVSSTRNVHSSKSDKCWRQKFEAIMCFGVPMIGMALHYVVQGHRLDLIEDFGCYPPVYFSIAAIFILWVPPFAMSLATFVYAALSLRHFLRHRIEFASHLQNSQSAITPTRYFRLMAMAVIEMIWDTGVNAYLIYFNTFAGILSWTTWDDVHSNFSRVAVFPKVLIPPIFITQLIWQWWIVPISCILFFIFFGFGEEAMTDYRTAFIWCRRNILRQNIEKPRPFRSVNALPTYRPSPRPSNSYNVDITLRTAEDDASERDAKGWDELSLKMPEIADHVALSPVGTPDPIANGRLISLVEPAQSFSLDEMQRSASIYTLESTSTTAGSSTLSSPRHGQDTSIPSLTITQPDSDIPSQGRLTFLHPLSTGRMQRTQAAIPREPSPAFSHSSSDRRSMGSAHGITVSPAYFPDEIATSRHHGEVLYFSEPSEPAATYVHGGVRVMVERSIV